MNRAYSTITVKAVDEEKREITGIASTPTPDRMGDIVEPAGVEFSLPIPLLWQHDHLQPIGQVTKAKVTKSGIEITAKLAQVNAPSGLAARLEEAWQSIKSGLVRGLSIGFSPTEYSFLDSGGIHFMKWNWHELSAVTIPANGDASITAIKSLDRQQRAALGKSADVVVRVKTAGASAQVTKTIQKPKSPEDEMNIQEQIKNFEDAKKQKAARQVEIMEKSATDGTTLDAEQTEEFDTLGGEIEAIDKHLDRLKAMEKNLVATARRIEADPSREVIAAAATGEKAFGNATVKAQPLKNGLAMAQVAKFLGRAQGNRHEALELAKAAQNVDARVVNVLKAAVAAGTTSSAAWAGNLVGDETSVYADFIEYLRPQTILGKFGQGGVPSLRNVPFRTALIGQTSGGAGYWVGEGQAKPLTSFDFSRTTLEPLKVANIAVITEEVLRDSSPSADMLIRDQLVAALRERLDIDFIDPAKAASAGVSPASILNGLTAINASGTGDADDVRADIKALFQQFIDQNNAPTNGVFIMPATTALSLSLMQNPLGQSEFPGLSMNGGNLFGLPVIVSEYVTSDSSGSVVALINASDIYLADEGGFQIDLSREASLQMDSAPDNPTTASTVLVSLWQRNLVGFRAERTINWARRRVGSAAYLDNVNWGAA